MSIFHRPLWRFPLWAALIVAVAAAAAAAELAWWLTVVAVFAAWTVVVAVERALARQGGGAARVRRPRAPLLAMPSSAPRPAAPEAAPGAGDPIESVVVVRPRGAVPGRQAAAAEPGPPPAAATLEPVAPPLPDELPPPADAPAPAPPSRAEPVRWNLWTLERIARAHAPGDDELAFLLVHLRDFADASGMLPADFDGLVRESFGDLLAAST